MKRIAAIVLGFLVAVPSAHAAILFDSTNAANKASGVALLWNASFVNCNLPGDPQPHLVTQSFEYSSSSAVVFDTVLIRTRSDVAATLCLFWANEVGAAGNACGAVAADAGYTTTTISYPAGYRPYTVIAGERLFFRTFDAATLPTDVAIDDRGKEEAAFPEIGFRTQHCGAANFALPVATYGVPAMRFTGTATAGANPPNPEDFGLTGTSTTVTQDFGFFGNMLREVFIWLFRPPATIQEAYNGAQSDLASKVPWGWWAQVSEGFAAVSSTQAATTTALTMDIPHNGVTTTVAIFDISAATALVPVGVREQIRTLGGVAMWALFGLWIWSLVTGSKPADDDEI